VANLETIEASEIAAIHRQHLPNAMNIHACRQPGVVDLYTLNMVYDKQWSPTIVDLAAVGKKFEVPLDHACQPIRLRDTQTEAVFIEWTVEAFQISPSVCEV
jgi:hypothetical protein